MPLSDKEIQELQPYHLIKLFHKLCLLHYKDKEYLIKLHKEVKTLANFLEENGFNSDKKESNEEK